MRRLIRLRGVSPRSIVAVAVAGSVVVSAALGWFAWALVQQDRALTLQRAQQRLDEVADAIVASYARSFSALDADLDALAAQPDPAMIGSPLALGVSSDPAGVLVRVRNGRASFYPQERLLFDPNDRGPAMSDSDSSRFAVGERLELRDRNYAAAIAEYRSIAASATGDVRVTADVRAAALARLARTKLKAGQTEAALATYRMLEQMTESTVDGRPATLLARHKICAVVEAARRSAELRAAATVFHTALYSGRWLVPRSLFEVYAADAERWSAGIDRSGLTAERMTSRKRLSLILGRLLAEPVGASGQRPLAGRSIVWDDDAPVVVVGRAMGADVALVVTRPAWLETRGSSDIAGLLGRANASLVLTDAAGRTIAGTLPSDQRPSAAREGALTGLPWSVRVVTASPPGASADSSPLRYLFIAAVGIMTALLVGGSYVVARAVARELEVSRLQSEFVATVSHEFRTPLASIRHVSDMLAENRVPDQEKRLRHYQALQSESGRLQRLVETLLDFRRMDEGARRYALEPCDVGPLLESVVVRFGGEVARKGYEVVGDVESGLPSIRADADALTLAIWNLLDNAVKYSPACKTVWLGAKAEAGSIVITVKDRGLGISKDDAVRVFDAFTRGSNAAASGAGGTGLGLSIVRHIVEAHHGTIALESEPATGSTFTLRLPVASDV